MRFCSFRLARVSGFSATRLDLRQTSFCSFFSSFVPVCAPAAHSRLPASRNAGQQPGNSTHVAIAAYAGQRLGHRSLTGVAGSGAHNCVLAHLIILISSYSSSSSSSFVLLFLLLLLLLLLIILLLLGRYITRERYRSVLVLRRSAVSRPVTPLFDQSPGPVHLLSPSCNGVTQGHTFRRGFATTNQSTTSMHRKNDTPTQRYPTHLHLT
jgi:hypothetical protein